MPSTTVLANYTFLLFETQIFTIAVNLLSMKMKMRFATLSFFPSLWAFPLTRAARLKPKYAQHINVCYCPKFACSFSLCHYENMFLTPSTGGLFVRSAAVVTAVSWNPFSSVLASVDKAKNCTIWSDA